MITTENLYNAIIKNQNACLIAAFIFALMIGNLVVLWLGATGLLLTALFLIPFDFVIRCLFQEQWQGHELTFRLGGLVVTASLLTYFMNSDTQAIAMASSLAFIIAQSAASVFYQKYIHEAYLIKVNGSDLVAIIIDSIFFQWLAFESVNMNIVLLQIVLKVFGGIAWYWLLFVKYKLQDTLLNKAA